MEFRWPDHSEDLRNDERRLFAECVQKWGSEAYEYHETCEYEGIANILNDVYGHGMRPYTSHSLRNYVQRVRWNARYRWPATRQHRYDVWRDEIEAERARLYGPWQRQLSKPAIP